MQKVAKGSPDMELKVTAIAELNGAAGNFAVGVGNESTDKSKFLSGSIPFDKLSSYTELSVSTTVKCKAFSIKNPCVVIGITCHSYLDGINFKNLQFKITFVK